MLLMSALASGVQAQTRVVANQDAEFKATLQARSRLLAGLWPVDAAMLRSPPAGDWLHWRRTYDAMGHSPLKAINRQNVSQLQLAWSWSLPQSVNEITPLLHDGVMFVASGARVQALDAASGDLLWQYVRPLPAGLGTGTASVVKNIAISGDRLFVPTADRHLVALSAQTGAVLWDHAVVDEATAAANPAVTGGPIVVRDKVIVGLSNCHRVKGGCFIVALDASTGEERWRFNTIARPGEPDGDSWNGAPADERFGGSVWVAGAYDPELDLLYFGVAQTYDAGTLLLPRPGTSAVSDNRALYTNSTVALAPETGKLVWHYQHFTTDVWDFDWSFERTLMTLRIDGEDRKVLATAGKLGIFDVLDRRTGRYLLSRDIGFQTLVASIDQTTGRKVVAATLAPKSDVPEVICPHSGGGRNWMATAFDPDTRTMFIPYVEACMFYTWHARPAEEVAKGGLDIRWVLTPPPGNDGHFGRVQALDLASGKTLWTRRQRAPESAALLSTAGGLVFEGGRDRRFRALDARTGATLWETRLPAQPSAYPISYQANGRQYVAVVAGGALVP